MARRRKIGMICAIQNKTARFLQRRQTCLMPVAATNVVALRATPHLNALLNKILPPGRNWTPRRGPSCSSPFIGCRPRHCIVRPAAGLTACTVLERSQPRGAGDLVRHHAAADHRRQWFYLGFQRDSGRMSRSAHTRKWWNNMRAIAFLTGLTWGSSALLHLYSSSVVFSSVLYLLTLGVLAGGATSQSPIPSNLVFAGVPILVPNIMLADFAFPGTAAMCNCCWLSTR
jgi:hypothetical protein